MNDKERERFAKMNMDMDDDDIITEKMSIGYELDEEEDEEEDELEDEDDEDDDEDDEDDEEFKEEYDCDTVTVTARYNGVIIAERFLIVMERFMADDERPNLNYLPNISDTNDFYFIALRKTGTFKVYEEAFAWAIAFPVLLFTIVVALLALAEMSQQVFEH
jgi:hypothetical protein